MCRRLQYALCFQQPARDTQFAGAETACQGVSSSTKHFPRPDGFVRVASSNLPDLPRELASVLKPKPCGYPRLYIASAIRLSAFIKRGRNDSRANPATTISRQCGALPAEACPSSLNAANTRLTQSLLLTTMFCANTLYTRGTLQIMRGSGPFSPALPELHMKQGHAQSFRLAVSDEMIAIHSRTMFPHRN
ncbi:hypothetical protein EJ03DRAFT_325499 [Teratosphaeria nubilosa]|uniref:Uncharacterized protein n=1 Tax=Teratosphaeria nubilosa TaxID=161662 RepID=A0A6G1LF13_9PEZI|nr:hypothetical protein EJ03DRAFT_325499 [Teratosphaeria nubilosa]